KFSGLVKTDSRSHRYARAERALFFSIRPLVHLAHRWLRASGWSFSVLRHALPAIVCAYSFLVGFALKRQNGYALSGKNVLWLHGAASIILQIFRWAHGQYFSIPR